MTTLLIDHDMEGQGLLLWGTLSEMSWVTLLNLKIATFRQVGLPVSSNDRDVWRFAQQHGYFLITNNRNMKGEDSLEQTIREENTATSLPILTVGNASRLKQRTYREDCATRIAEIVMYPENASGRGRIFIP